MTPEDLDAIEARANAAKEHDFESECDETFECPLCGEGILDGRLYDSKTEAATVVAYGIGKGLRAAEDWVKHGPEDCLALVAEVRMLRMMLRAK